MSSLYERALALDAADPLAALRDRFEIPDGAPLYVDGNSLGRPPAATRARLAELQDAWASRLVGGWDDWLDLPLRVGDLLAEHVLGARPGEVVCCDSVTVNLYKLATAALDVCPGAIVACAADFPTDRYVLAGVAARAGRAYVEVAEPTAEAVAGAGAVEGEVALVSLSHVDYRTGALTDLDAVRAVALERGALTLWDLSHSAGAVEIGLDGRADLAVGCTYKYLDGGPGAPAYLYVREGLQEQLRSPIQGWFGQVDQFAMGPAYEPRPGVGRFLAGTPPITGLVMVQAAVELVAEAGIARIAEKGRALTGFAIDVADAWLEPLGFAIGTPRDPAARGAHVALLHPDARRLTAELVAAGVVPDFREPDVIRLGLSPLDIRFADVLDALERIRDLAAV